MKFAMRDFSDAIEALLRDDKLKTVTVFCDPLANVKQRVRVTRRQKDEVLVTYGKPNYAERELLASCKKAKCKPRRILLKFKPVKKKTK